MKQKTRNTFELKISAATENLGIIRDFVSRLAHKVGFSAEEVDQIVLAVDEACTNVIKHAYKFDASRLIEIEITIDSKKITILITDHGNGFDLSKLPKPNLNVAAKKARAGGLGIHLMKKLMDDVQFNIVRGKMTQVRLIKYKSRKTKTT